jgi:hypothetical protein
MLQLRQQVIRLRTPQCKSKNRASAGVIVGPQPAVVSLHDTPAYRQTDAHAIRLGRDEWLKQIRPNLFWETRAGVGNADLHHLRSSRIGGNYEFTSWLLLHRYYSDNIDIPGLEPTKRRTPRFYIATVECVT